MDHRWDESTKEDRAERADRERFGTSRIEHDPDVERRDRMRLEERRRVSQKSPWEIGEAWYDQRDLYTCNASIEADGYGRGPSFHPDEGSYAYHRDAHPGIVSTKVSHASLYEREAWPWLNYKDAEDDPYFAFLHEHEPSQSQESEYEREHVQKRPGFWERMRFRLGRALHMGKGVPEVPGADTRILIDVERALARNREIDVRAIDVNVKRSDVTLEGTVPNRRAKRLASEVALTVLGVRDVHNRLAIRRDDAGDTNAVFVLPTALFTA